MDIVLRIALLEQDALAVISAGYTVDDDDDDAENDIQRAKFTSFQVSTSPHQDGKFVEYYIHRRYIKAEDSWPKFFEVHFVVVEEDMCRFFRCQTQQLIQEIVRTNEKLSTFNCCTSIVILRRRCAYELLYKLLTDRKLCSFKMWLLGQWQKRKSAEALFPGEAEMFSKEKTRRFVVGLNFVMNASAGPPRLCNSSYRAFSWSVHSTL